MLPDFMIVGAPKAATTSLYHYLGQHPQVFMSTPKEVNYFSGEEITRQGLFYDDFKVETLADYEALFAEGNKFTAVGEASVSYLFYPETPAKILAVIPDVKIIILLRDPLERGFSHYLMDYRLGLCKKSYADIVFQHKPQDHADLFYQQYVELGLYAGQIQRYFATFPRENIRIYLQEDLLQNPQQVVHELYQFLGVDPAFQPDFAQSHNAFTMPKNSLVHSIYASRHLRKLVSVLFPARLKALITAMFFEKGKKPALDDTLKQHLQQIYRADIAKLEGLIHRDLSAWK